MTGKEIKNLLTDAATVAGCCIGVGFISGKEAQVYFGSPLNVVIFAIFFAPINCLLREFCRARRCCNVKQLLTCCFGKWSTVLTTLFLMCCFVCVVTMLAGVNCLTNSGKLPTFSILCALLAAAVLKGGMKLLKMLNVVSIVVALLFLVTFALCEKHVDATNNVSAIQPIKYAMFSTTMSLGVLAPLSQASKKNNAYSTLFATGFVAFLLVVVLKVGNFSEPLPMFGKNTTLNILGGIAVILATVTGIVANTLPLLENLHDVFEDDSLCIACTMCLAVAFSLFGFDFTLRFGYIFVSIVGAVLTTTVAIKTIPILVAKRKKRLAGTLR